MSATPFTSPERRALMKARLGLEDDDDSTDNLSFTRPDDTLRAQLLNASRQMKSLEMMLSEHQIPGIDKSNEIHDITSEKLDVNPIEPNNPVIVEDEPDDSEDQSNHRQENDDAQGKDNMNSIDYLKEDHELDDIHDHHEILPSNQQQELRLSIETSGLPFGDAVITNGSQSVNTWQFEELASSPDATSKISEQLDKIRLIANYYDDKQNSILSIPRSEQYLPDPHMSQPATEEKIQNGDGGKELDQNFSAEQQFSPDEQLDEGEEIFGQSILHPSASVSPPRLNQSLNQSHQISSTSITLRQSLQDMELHDLYSDHDHRSDRDDMSQRESIQEKNNLLMQLLNPDEDLDQDSNGRFGDSKPFHDQIAIPDNPLANERVSMIIRSKSMDEANDHGRQKTQRGDEANDCVSSNRRNSRNGMTSNPMLMDKRELQRIWGSHDADDHPDNNAIKDLEGEEAEGQLRGDLENSPQRLLNPLTEVVRVDNPDHNRYSTPSRLQNNQSKSRNSSPISTISAVNSAGNNEKPVKVVIRVRPFTDYEYDHRAKRTISKSGPDLIVVNPNAFDVEPDMIAKAAITVNDKQWAQPFRFDDCLWSYDPSVGRASYVDQLGVYESIGTDIVENVMNGVSCTCFAYGSSGTGKTYTLFGGSSRSPSNGPTRSKSPSSIHRTSMQNRNRDHDDKITSESGIAPRVFADIVNSIKSSRIKTPYNRIFFSFIEIYNEKVIDLLADASDNSTVGSGNSFNNTAQFDTLKVREHPIYGPYVENLRKVEIYSVEDVLRLIVRGQRNRSTTKTTMNPESSRSHVICTLELTTIDLNLALRPEKTVWTKREPMKKLGTPSHATARMDLDSSASAFNISVLQGPNSVIKVQMVDLAGSDKMTSEGVGNISHNNEKSPGRYGMTTDPAIEKDKVELKMIRRSLNTLSQIVQSLGKGVSFRSLPYRDSVLTFLLRDALNGYNHTTMIATISPSHLSYEDTVATLRYAEKLCLIRKKSLSQIAPPQSTGLPLLTNGGYHDVSSMNRFQQQKPQQHENPYSDLVLQQSRHEMDEDFRRLQQDLGSTKKGSLAARQLLQHTISDPQQRIAKLTRNADAQQSSHSHSQANQTFGHNRHTTPRRPSYNRSIPSDVTFTSPIDGTVRRLKELTGDDLDHLQSSYRNLQGQVIELQIDLDSLRTDRDSMVVELRGARDHINELEQEKYDMNMRNQNMNKSLQSAEKELNDLRGLIRRREEALERIMNELNEEKQSRVNAEQAYHTRTNDFLTRFDNLKKENKMLQNALEVARSRDGFSGVEKQQLLEQISELQNTLADQSRTLHIAQKDNTQLREELATISIKANKFDEIAPKHQALQEEKVDLFSKLDKLRGDYEVLLTERNSLSSLVEQKDSLLWLQNQQSESNIKLLQSQIQQLQLQQQTMIKSEDWQRMQESIRHVFSNENEVLYHEITDTKKLTGMIKDLHEKSKYFEKVQKKLDKENHLRKELESKLIESVKLLKAEETAKHEQEEMVAMLEKELSDAVKMNSYAIKNSRVKTKISNHIKANATTAQSLNNLHNLSSLLPHESVMQDDDATVAHLVQQLEQARSDNAYLLGQLEATQKENIQLKDELTNTQANMQKEFSALWMSVQELNKLDALKDKSIQDLIAERTQLTTERDLAHEKLKSLSLEMDKMKRETYDFDQELERATTASLRALSAQSGTASSPANIFIPAEHQRKSALQLLASSSPENPLNTSNLDESEKILERQIEELSDFLQDEERLKKVRNSTSRPYLNSSRVQGAHDSNRRLQTNPGKPRRPTPSGTASSINRFR